MKLEDSFTDIEDEQVQRANDLAQAHAAMSDRPSGGRWDIAIATPSELKWRHQHWWTKRERIKSLLRTGVLGERNRDRFAQCGALARVEFSPEKKRHRVTAQLCKSRHCEPCARQKAGRIAGNLRKKLAACPPGSFRFITLTLRHQKTDRLADLLKKLVRCFRALRARPVWKNTQDGGAFMIEVKYGTNGWHPHIHAICEGRWMSSDQLTSEWNRCTGDSFAADIRRIPDADALAGYATKYITKSTSDSVWADDDVAIEYLTAIKGTRSCATLGRWRGLQLTKPAEKITDWKSVGDLTTILRDARNAQPYAMAITLSLRPPAEHTEDRKPNATTPPGPRQAQRPRHFSRPRPDSATT